MQNDSRVVFWSFDYSQISSAYRYRPALDTIEWLLDGTIQGTVTCTNVGGNNLEMSNAIVRITGVGNPNFSAAARTDYRGHYVAYGIPPGIYDVEVSVNGCWAPDPIYRVGVIGGRDTILNFNVYPDDYSTATIWGYVNENNAPLAGAQVTIAAVAGNQNASTVSDVNGRFEFNNLASGEYTLSAIHPVTQVKITVRPNPTVSKGENQRVDIIMSSGPQKNTIRGRVFNASTLAPYLGATVTLLQGTTIKSTQTTDMTGQYNRRHNIKGLNRAVCPQTYMDTLFKHCFKRIGQLCLFTAYPVFYHMQIIVQENRLDMGYHIQFPEFIQQGFIGYLAVHYAVAVVLSWIIL
jgi:hypothetical protein